MKAFDYLADGDVYLDSACQSLRPRPVIDALSRYYTEHNSCGERVKYAWGRKTDELVEETGWSKKTIDAIRKSSVASVNGGMFGEDDEGDDGFSDPGLVRPSKVPYAAEAVYMGLDDTDKAIFDGRTGMHGKKKESGSSLADMLNISQAAISQRS